MHPLRVVHSVLYFHATRRGRRAPDLTNQKGQKLSQPKTSLAAPDGQMRGPRRDRRHRVPSLPGNIAV